MTVFSTFKEYSDELKGCISCAVVFNLITVNTQAILDTFIKGFIGMAFSVGTFLIINYIKKRIKKHKS